MGEMTADHKAHLARIRVKADKMIEKKYIAGQLEHGGRLWEKPDLLKQALDEATDMVVYLLTLKEQQDSKKGVDKV